MADVDARRFESERALRVSHAAVARATEAAAAAEKRERAGARAGRRRRRGGRRVRRRRRESVADLERVAHASPPRDRTTTTRRVSRPGKLGGGDAKGSRSTGGDDGGGAEADDVDDGARRLGDWRRPRRSSPSATRRPAVASGESRASREIRRGEALRAELAEARGGLGLGFQGSRRTTTTTTTSRTSRWLRGGTRRRTRTGRGSE